MFSGDSGRSLSGPRGSPLPFAMTCCAPAPFACFLVRTPFMMLLWLFDETESYARCTEYLELLACRDCDVES